MSNNTESGSIEQTNDKSHKSTRHNSSKGEQTRKRKYDDMSKMADKGQEQQHNGNGDNNNKAQKVLPAEPSSVLVASSPPPTEAMDGFPADELDGHMKAEGSTGKANNNRSLSQTPSTTSTAAEPIGQQRTTTTNSRNDQRIKAERHVSPQDFDQYSTSSSSTLIMPVTAPKNSCAQSVQTTTQHVGPPPLPKIGGIITVKTSSRAPTQLPPLTPPSGHHFAPAPSTNPMSRPAPAFASAPTPVQSANRGPRQTNARNRTTAHSQGGYTPKPSGAVDIVIFKWEKAWLCLTPSAAEKFMPGVVTAATDPHRNGTASAQTNVADSDAGHQLEIAEEEEEESGTHRPSAPLSRPASSRGPVIADIDPKVKHVLWNNKEGICRVTPLQALLDGWKRCKPRYVFLSQQNQDGLFDNLFMEIFKNHANKLSQFSLVGAVDSCSTTSRALEQRLLLIHQVNVPPPILQNLVRTTRLELAERKRRRRHAAASAPSRPGQPPASLNTRQKFVSAAVSAPPATQRYVQQPPSYPQRSLPQIVPSAAARGTFPSAPAYPQQHYATRGY